MLTNFSKMKFGEQLASHLTPEWRKQYIRYEELKSMLYQIVLEAPTEGEARQQFIAQADESFFAECERELTKINLFFSQKIAESQGKYHELHAELRTFKVSGSGLCRVLACFIYRGVSKWLRYMSKASLLLWDRIEYGGEMYVIVVGLFRSITWPSST